MKWLTPVKPEKTPVRQMRCFIALSSGLTPPPPIKNARRAAAAGHKTTQRRRRPPVRRRTALVCIDYRPITIMPRSSLFVGNNIRYRLKSPRDLT